ncbi:MAG: hypothetical protein IPP35_08055 [Elusimicrobia bacterium]|nr:hypothetical protein [Elusimicrobiota bacterium]
MKWMRVALLLPLLWGFVGCAYKSQLVHNVSMDVPAKVDARPAILKTLKIYHWKVIADNNGVIDAKQEKDAYYAIVRITYTKDTVAIKHLESQGMRYTNANGEERIHTHYNTWANNLEKSIKMEMAPIQ